VAVLAAGGCITHPPNADAARASQSPLTGSAVEARADLTRRVAAAKDRRFTAGYSWTVGSAKRTVTVTVAADQTWRVDVPGGALGGKTAVALIGRPDGVYQCATGSCVRVSRTAATVPAEYDVQVHHPFTDWPSVLTDPNAALAVAAVSPLPGATGTCFSVEPTTVAISPPLQSGVFCYDDTGLVTAVKTRAGTLTLGAPAGAAPPTAALTDPVRPGPGLGTAAPAAPASSGPAPASPTPSTKPSRRG
jgi:hypothetical protein